MKLRSAMGISLFAALASCGPQHQPEEPARNRNAPVLPGPSAPPAVNNRAGAPKSKAKPTVDPKSTEAADDLVRSFVDLLNRHKFNEAYMLLGPTAPPRSDFDSQFSRYSSLHVAIGTPEHQEGAAGSIYLSIPLKVSGDLDGKSSTRSATAILRRVNDVPGSTEAQRRWHIERIDWKA